MKSNDGSHGLRSVVMSQPPLQVGANKPICIFDSQLSTVYSTPPFGSADEQPHRRRMFREPPEWAEPFDLIACQLKLLVEDAERHRLKVENAADGDCAAHSR